MRKFAFLSTLLLTLPVAAGLTEGMGYFDRQLYPQAFNEFKPLADRGNEQAQYYTAYLYLNGYGVTADENLGLQYLNKSADQGYEKAQALLSSFEVSIGISGFIRYLRGFNIRSGSNPDTP